MKFSMVYITAKDREQARMLAWGLLEEYLVACVNIVEPALSLYRWEGQVQEETEAVLICKTRRKLLPRVIERVKQLHDYACPCIVSYTMDRADSGYLAWLEEMTQPPTQTVDS